MISLVFFQINNGSAEIMAKVLTAISMHQYYTHMSHKDSNWTLGQCRERSGRNYRFLTKENCSRNWKWLGPYKTRIEKERRDPENLQQGRDKIRLRNRRNTRSIRGA